MLDLSRMLGRFEGGMDNSFAGRPQQMMQERWQGMGQNFMGGQGIRDLLRNRFRDVFGGRFGGERRSNDPSPPMPVNSPQEPMEEGDPYGNPFTPAGVSLGSMLTRRPIS